MEAKSWEYVFVATGVALILTAVMSMIVFRRFAPSEDFDEVDTEPSDQADVARQPMSASEGLTVLFTDWRYVCL